MKCKNCGGLLNDEDTVCCACGATVIDVETDAQVGKKGLRKIIFAVAMAIFAVAISIVAMLLLRDREVKRFSKEIENSRYSVAYELYLSLQADDKTKSNSWLETYIKEVKNSYYSGEYDYITTESILQNLLIFPSTYNGVTETLTEIAEDNQNEISYQTAQQHYEREEWKEAYEKLEWIDANYRRYDEVVSLRSQCLESYRGMVLEKCEQYQREADYVGVFDVLEEALRLFPEDIELIKTEQNYRYSFIDTSVAQAEEYAGRNEYEEAITVLELASELVESEKFNELTSQYRFGVIKNRCKEIEADGGSGNVVVYLDRLIYSEENCGGADRDAVLQLLSEYEAMLKAEVLFEAKEYQKVGDYLAAVLCVDSYRDFYDCEEFRAVIEECSELYGQQILDKAAEFAGNREFEKAIQYIEDAEGSYYCSEEFQKRIEEYKEFLPRKLTHCNMLEELHYGAIETTNSEDKYGNFYEDAMLYSAVYWLSHDAEYRIYYLGGKYVELKGILVADVGQSTGAAPICKIYADGKLIYESIGIENTTSPIEVRLNITGVTQLKVEFSDSSQKDVMTIFDATVS